MTDVRLTALNPEDSQVYPVACNSSGELIVSSESEDKYVEKSGDNMTGDLTLGDKITLDASAGSVVASGVVGTAIPTADFGLFVNNTDSNSTSFVVQGSGKTSLGPGSGNIYGIALNPRDSVNPAYITLTDTEAAGVPNLSLSASGVAYYYDGTESKWKIESDGSAAFAGDVQVKPASSGWWGDGGVNIGSGGSIYISQHTNTATNEIFKCNNPNLGGDVVIFEAGGSAAFHGVCVVGDRLICNKKGKNANASTSFISYQEDGVTAGVSFTAGGKGDFSGELIIGSRGQKWLIRESNGVAMLVEQGLLLKESEAPEYPEVRDLPRELDLVEAALNEVMERLRMTPPAGWPVWDGSDNSR